MSKEDHSIQRGQELGLSEYTFSGPLIDLLLDITPVMQRAGLNAQDFIESVTSHAEDLGTGLVRDANALSVLDPEFSNLSERDQRDFIYTANDATYGRYFHVMLRDLKKEADNGSRLAKQKHQELMQALGVREEREEEAGDEGYVFIPTLTGRNQYFELPMGCPRPSTLGDFFTTPVLIPKDIASPMQLLKAFSGIFSQEDRLSREELTDLKDSIYDERLLTHNDLLNNTTAQTKLATTMGVLEEGELFENFLRREDMHVVGIDDHRSYQNMVDGMPQAVVGMQKGIKGFGRKQGEIYFGGLPFLCDTPTKYPGIRISIHFIANEGSIMEKGDRHIPLDSLIARGRATPKMTLYVPTDYLVPLKTS